MGRSDISFPSNGTECAAWLYRPEGDGPHPLVVMAHGFSATRELGLEPYAQRFCAAGLGVLLFDYRHFGASGGEPRQLLDIREQHADYHAAIAWGRRLDWVDPARVALFGSSFSGGHVVVVASQDPRIAAVVAQCPFEDGIATARALFGVNMLKLTAAGIRDQVGALTGRAPHYVPAVGEPGSFAVMTTPDSRPGFDAIVPADTRWENRVAARIALHFATYRPGASARHVRCPILFCVCDRDALAPAEATVRHAHRAPLAEVKRYPIGHFDIYVGEWYERAVADQVAFLTRHLLDGDPAAASGGAAVGAAT
jgi:pimeloyl-ACP methyl ester carboxylesterase